MQTLVRDVLAAWRDAERLSTEAAMDAPRQVAAAAAVTRLRALYLSATSMREPTDPDPRALRDLLDEIRASYRLGEAAYDE
jgi:hypothetical protein